LGNCNEQQEDVKKSLLLIVTVCAALVALVNLSGADVFTQIPPIDPKIRLAFQAVSADFDNLKTVLLRFAGSERFSVLDNPPRAKGKQFFLFLIRDDGVGVAVEKLPSEPLVILYCYEGGPEAHCAEPVSRLQESLTMKWPDIKPYRGP